MSARGGFMMNKTLRTRAIIVATIMAIIVCALYIFRPAKIDGIPDRIIEVPESYGPIISIARRTRGLTIAFESGDILFLSIKPNSEPHIKVIWISEAPR